MRFWRMTTDGVAVAIRVQPKSRRPGLHGVAGSVDGERLRIGVAAAPEGGRANRAACAALARALDLPAACVSVAIGATRREKTLLVGGLAAGDVERISARLAAL
jgi:uncharacterized protein YggU (UPF0235/DUF167 family)